jgi:NAD(P)-dependent dehydrogenase (short-subunit alcohol dehydrogenase family)
MFVGEMPPLEGHTALVTGATRGTGRATAIELGAAGATVYVTGRSAGGHRSPMNRPETLEETAELVERAGGTAIAVRCDHTQPEEVRALVERIDAETGGRLDVLVNDIWGGDPLTRWGVPFWEHPLEDGLRMQELGLHTHLVTSWHAAPLMARRGRGLIVEVTDGVSDDLRGSLFYDLVKASVIRVARSQAADLRDHGVAVVAISPGFLRSEAMLDHFGVTEATWRDAIAQDRHFAASETPRFVGRGIAALAADPEVLELTGQAFGSWHLGRRYGLQDVDGSRPDWGAWYDAEVVSG